MYLFDREDFNCDVIPNDWEDYATTIRALFDANLKCLNNLIKSKQSEVSTETYNKLLLLFQDYLTAVNDTKASLNTLVQELSANPSGSTCFDKTLYINYLSSYSIVQDLLQEINLLIITNGDIIGYDLNVSSDTTLIYPVSGSSSTKVLTCTGVYMKQMDFGSEFIGSVSINTPLVINRTWYEGPTTWEGLTPPQFNDGNFYVRS